MEDKRKLVTLKTIDALTPIKGADAIEAAHIGGWTAVVRKGEFYQGQQVFYFETDSMLPLDKEPFAFLRSRGVKEQNGREYHRLKAMKLRGVVSDGLLLPFSIVSYFEADLDKQLDILNKIQENGGDFSNWFGVVKYEDPILAKLGGKMTRFPEWITRTDEERIQNLPKLIEHIAKTDTWDDWYATEKIDGTSCTIWCRINDKGEYEYGVCSRNYGLEEEEDNTYWKIAKTPSIEYAEELMSPLDYLKLKCLEDARSGVTNTPAYVLQGEIFGEGIQNNPIGIRGQRICFFNLLENGKFVLLETIRESFPELVGNWVPIHPTALARTMEDIISQPDGVKTLVPGGNKDAQIEGFVWRNKVCSELEIAGRKTADEIDWDKIPEDKWDLVKASLNEHLRSSFKAISDKYRLKHQN